MIQQLINQINKLPTQSIIFISGYGGAGKSTLARKLKQHIPCQIVEFDDFYREMDTYNYWDCYNYERLIQEILIPYKNNHTNSYHAYNWPNPQAPQIKELTRSKFLIVEGVGLFTDELLSYSDVSIWIDCPLERAIKQGKERDLYEYGLDNIEMWDTVWKQKDIAFEQRNNPRSKATIQYKK